MDDVIYQDHEGSESDITPRSDNTDQTAHRGRDKDKKIIKDKLKEKKVDLSKFRQEPERPANSKRWIQNAARLFNVQIVELAPDEKLDEIVSELQEDEKKFSDESELSSEKTLEQLYDAHIDEKDRIHGDLSEESYAEDDALFYRNEYPYDTHESISSVRTEELEPMPKTKMRQDFTEWMRESLAINQRTFNVNEVIGNFPRDNYGRIINRSEIIR